MKKLLFTLLICLGSFIGFSQAPQYEILISPKLIQAFTDSNIIELESKIVTLQSPTDTVYYNVNEWTQIKIYPTGNIINAIKEEQ